MKTRTHRHFVGIGGIGMSALARLALARGERVSGCDADESETVVQLRAEGASVSIGHAPLHVDDADEVVVTSAVDFAHPEVARAVQRGIPVTTRGAHLAHLVDLRRGIAICGTHGKTTTTAMTHTILRGCGLDAGLALGGIDIALGTNAVSGSSPWFVTEADESDGSFALLHPQIAVLTNLEDDHVTDAGAMERLNASFESFLAELPEEGVAIIGTENARSARLSHITRRARTLTFGLAAPTDIAAENIRFQGFGSSFDVISSGVCAGSFELAVPGLINVENALAAIAVGRALELPFAQIAQTLREFRGVRRRFEILAETPQMVLIDDYAHHPTAVRETIAAARAGHVGPVVVVFQPHRYSRTAYHANNFAQAFREADIVYLTPVYAAAEMPLFGISERSIGEPLRSEGHDVQYVQSVADIPSRLEAEVPPGSLVLMLGAGSITYAAQALAQRLRLSAVVR